MVFSIDWESDKVKSPLSPLRKGGDVKAAASPKGCESATTVAVRPLPFKGRDRVGMGFKSR
jgi:hypothetical protein